MELRKIIDISFFLFLFSYLGINFGYFLFLMTPIGSGSALISWVIALLFCSSCLLLVKRGRLIKDVFVGVIFTGVLILGLVFLSEAPRVTVFSLLLLSTGAYGLFRLIDCIMCVRKTKRSMPPEETGRKDGGLRRALSFLAIKTSSAKNPSLGKKVTVLGVAALLVGMVLSGIPFLFPEAISYSVSQQQAEDTEIVLYWHTINYEALNESIVDICYRTDTVLSLNMMEHNFEDGNPRGEKVAEVIQYANEQGVKIEVYPIFEIERGWYPSYNETYMLMELYETFSNWTAARNLSVDYFLFDIEPSLENDVSLDGPPYSGWAEGIPIFEDVAQMGIEINNMHVRRENWEDVLSEWRRVLNRIEEDGLTPRATMAPYYYDLLDGDSDIQIKGGTPAFDILDHFEYISMLIYRGCEWGNHDAREYLYRATKTLDAYIPGHVAVCIGCLNFRAYPTEDSIVDDINLAIAHGANSVRIFEGSYWILGHGFLDGAEGTSLESLESILTRAREGGSGELQTDGLYQAEFAGAVLLDVLHKTM